jgi:hypothetical protein
MDRPDIGRRERNRWRRIDRSAVRTEALAEQEWATHAKPVADHLDRKITRSEQHVAELESHARFRQRWLNEHPELARRIEHTQRELQRLHDPAGVELLDHTDAIMQKPVGTSPNLERPDIARIRERLDRLEHQRGIDPPALSL